VAHTGQNDAGLRFACPDLHIRDGHVRFDENEPPDSAS